MISLRLQATTSDVRVGLSGPSCRSDPCVVSSGTRFTMPHRTQTLDVTWMAAVKVVKDVSGSQKSNSIHSTCMQKCQHGHLWWRLGPSQSQGGSEQPAPEHHTVFLALIGQGSFQVQAEPSPNAHLKDCGSLEDLERQLHGLRQVHQRA
jgi:hypothetical protein